MVGRLFLLVGMTIVLGCGEYDVSGVYSGVLSQTENDCRLPIGEALDQTITVTQSGTDVTLTMEGREETLTGTAVGDSFTAEESHVTESDLLASTLVRASNITNDEADFEVTLSAGDIDLVCKAIFSGPVNRE